MTVFRSVSLFFLSRLRKLCHCWTVFWYLSQDWLRTGCQNRDNKKIITWELWRADDNSTEKEKLDNTYLIYFIATIFPWLWNTLTKYFKLQNKEKYSDLCNSIFCRRNGIRVHQLFNYIIIFLQAYYNKCMLHLL